VTEKELIQILNRLYPSIRWPKPFNLLQGRVLIRQGKAAAVAAREVGTTAPRLSQFLEAKSPVDTLLGEDKPDEQSRKRVRQILGNLIVGKCAEISFEEIYKEHTRTTELELRDLREGRSDTDYRLFNGRGRPVYRINIKFHGSLFRRAKEMVGLDPEDCFALATYKINGALEKQQKDELPYIFVIVSVPNLTADSIGAAVPNELQDFIARITASKQVPLKRDIEDRVVDVLRDEEHGAFGETRQRIRQANWYVLGAKKADNC